MTLPIDPVRLCCGQRHMTTQCPDGLVMCCLCFHRFPIAELTTEPNGDKVDVCMGCTVDEAYTINYLNIERCKRGTSG